MIVDNVEAFCAHGPIERQDRLDGPLSDLTFGLKDFFDLAGSPTGAGSPDWLSTHAVPTETAPAVELLFKAGAKLVGKTHTDELAWSLTGRNPWYGTPVNIAAPDRMPGGSSSGSAAATAASMVDFAIGSDTGGSVRLPASFCGLYGIRTTHGLISLEGAVPLAPSYDTLGWFARDASTFDRVASVMLPPVKQPTRFTKLLIATNLFDKASDLVRKDLLAALEQVKGHFKAIADVTVAQTDLAAWAETFRVVQASEAFATHKAWVEQEKPRLSVGLQARFDAAARLTAPEILEAKIYRAQISDEMRRLVEPGVILAIPTCPDEAPLLTSTAEQLELFRARAIELLSPAGHSGLPQISIPVNRRGAPIGLSLIGSRGSDGLLVKLAKSVGALSLTHD